MGFIALSFPLGTGDPDVAEAVCVLLGALAVTFSDLRDDGVLEPAPGEVRLWPATRVQALFAAHTDAARVRCALAVSLALEPERIATEDIDDRPWEREWLRDFHAMRFGRRLWVCPHHERVDDPAAAVVRLDPGLAFGTGTHATTALCLEWLDAYLEPESTVIDYGCGSGVLGIAAARLGAREVCCYDIDPQAVTAARDNAAANSLSARVSVVTSAERLPRGVDVVIANILASTLCALTRELGALVRPGGRAVLSGILEREADEVTHACRAWFDSERVSARDGWVCLAARRRAYA